MTTSLRDDEGRSIRLLRPLGKGGFGSVWQAEVTAPSGLVHHMALKLLHEELMNDADLVARARDEARLMSQLNHDHVVKVHALTTLSGRAAVLMEYVEGIDCTALLNAARQSGEPGLPITVGLAIVERSAAALHAAWTTISPQTGRPLCVVHRDIKPSNLLLSVTGQVKVMDFGVARADFHREAQTESVQFGTQRFMAPERWLHGVAGPESDIFSLGVTLWELLVGAKFERLPLSEAHFDDKRQEQIRALEHRTPLDPAGLGAAQELLRGMLEFDPARRPTAAQVEERASDLLESTRGPDLRRWARKHVPPLVESRQRSLDRDHDLAELSGTLARRTEPEETAATPSIPRTPAPILPATTPPPEPTWTPEPTTAPQRPAFLGAAAGLALVLGLGGVAVWQLIPGEAPDEPLVEVPTDEPVPAEALALPAAEVDATEPVRAVVDEPVPRAVATRSQPKSVEPEPEPVAELEPEPATEPPTTVVHITERPAVTETVTIKVLADPSDGYALADGQRANVRESLTLTVGATTGLKFTWPDAQTLRCDKVITADLTKIKFDQESQKCTYSF
ncbi:MAG: protein kinase [Proteobacteria bacterium]|nr:protein kinase [Pseudomonadota bacterium]MCP4918116.1 protein kinase [Pseudomonadota bacterium]